MVNTHKKRCIDFCKEFLTQMGYSQIFELSNFLHRYRKTNGSNKNAYSVGLDAADYMIRENNLK